MTNETKSFTAWIANTGLCVHSLFNLNKSNLSKYCQIYKSRWSLTKFLYLACRYTPIVFLPFALYAYIPDHDLETCHHFLNIISLMSILVVCLSNFTLTINLADSGLIYIPLTSHASLSVYMSFAHGHSQVQNAFHCSSIYPASLATSSLSPGIHCIERNLQKIFFTYLGGPDVLRLTLKQL